MQLLYFLRQSAPFSAARSYATTGHQIGFNVSDEKFTAATDQHPGDRFFLSDSVEGSDGDTEILRRLPAAPNRDLLRSIGSLCSAVIVAGHVGLPCSSVR